MKPLLEGCYLLDREAKNPGYLGILISLSKNNNKVQPINRHVGKTLTHIFIEDFVDTYKYDPNSEISVKDRGFEVKCL